MSSITLFRRTIDHATELQCNAYGLENLKTLIEANLGAPLNIRFLASEYSTDNKSRSGS